CRRGYVGRLPADPTRGGIGGAVPHRSSIAAPAIIRTDSEGEEPVRYYIWTVGCQMNEADSERIERSLQDRGLEASRAAEQADVVILNTCSVRQAAEEKALGKIGALRPLKIARPDLIVAFGGCMVAPDTVPHLRTKLPYVDVFFPPSEPGQLLDLIDQRMSERNLGVERDLSSEGCLAPT